MGWRENSVFLEGFFACDSPICKPQRTLGPCSPLHPTPLWGLCQSTAVTEMVTLNLCPALTWVTPAMLRAFPSRGAFPA